MNRSDDKVLAKMNVIMDKAQYEKGRSLKEDLNPVEKVLQEAVATGRVGNLAVDPGYLVFESQGCEYIYKSKIILQHVL
jgi:hypothetical protein